MTACLAVFLIFFAVLLGRILSINQGHFSYSLDDAYIHLALAERLARGLYGLNIGEIEAPASSIMWPFLLVPGAGTGWHPYLPLVYNFVFGSLTALLLGRIARSWQWLREGKFQVLICWTTAVLLVLGANLAGLAFTGMEHSLQVLLAVVCAFGLTEAYSGRPVPAWCIAATIAAPALRYECYTLCVALAIALFAQKRRRTAFAVLTVSLIVPSLFALFLIRHGLPPLPNSVLVKGGAFASPKSVGANLFHTIADNSLQYIRDRQCWPMTILLLPFAVLLWRERGNPRHRAILGGTALALLLHMVMGRYGWFYRYEVYSKILAILVILFAMARFRGPVFVAGVLACLAYCDIPYLKAFVFTPVASHNIYQQQYQMHRFAQSYGGNFAVNDLGWVSYQAKPSTYVMDLFGLASLEAMRQVDKGPDWLDDVTRRHRCGLVMIYSNWFPVVPKDWTPLGRMTSSPPAMSVVSNNVYFYETPFGTEQERLEMPSRLQTFIATLPPGTSFAAGQAIP